MRIAETIASNDLAVTSAVPLNVKPSLRTFNSWDSVRYSQRAVPTIHTTLEAHPDTFAASSTLESQTQRRSSLAPSVRVDESRPDTPNIIYRLGWRSVLQIVGVAVATCTLGIASSNLWLRLHHAVTCDIPKLPPT